jgi:hypothetical protein
MKTTTQHALKIGLSIQNTISDEGLDWIRKHDYDLYCDIMKRRER